MKFNPLKLLEEHVEKIVLAICAGFLLYMSWGFLINSPNVVKYENKPLGPGEIDQAMLESARGLQSAIQNAKHTPTEIKDFGQELVKTHEAGIRVATVAGGPTLPDDLPRVEPFGQEVRIPGIEDDEKPGTVALVTPLPPRGLASSTGRSVVDPEGGETREVHWVSVGAYFDIKAQRDLMTQAKYAPYRARVYFVGVDIERQEMLASGEWSPWEQVDTTDAVQLEIPEPVYDDQTGQLVNKQELDDAFGKVKESQFGIMQPAFLPVQAGDAWRMPPLKGHEEIELVSAAQPRPRPQQQPREPRQPRPTRPPAGGGGAIGISGGAVQPPPPRPRERDRDRDREPPPVVAEPEPMTPEPMTPRPGNDKATLVVNPQAPDSQPALWVHDTSVQPGKTYRYRLRVELWNRYVGRGRLLTDPAGGKQSVLRGQWSLPSDPVTVEPNYYFYVQGKFDTDEVASVDIYKSINGEWKKLRMDVKAGDMIGEIRRGEDFTTNALVLDLDRRNVPVATGRSDGFTERDALVMTYLDPFDGQVKQRIDWQDRYNPKRKQFEEMLKDRR